MKKLESNILNMAVVLTVIAVVAGGLLAWVNNVTAGPIEQINNQAIENGIKSVILGYTVLEHSETPGLGAQADGWFRQPVTAQAEQSAVVDVLLGAPGKPGNHNIIGMNPGDDLMMVSKDGGQVDAITASTITSKAFLRAVNGAYKALFGYTAADAVSGASSQN